MLNNNFELKNIFGLQKIENNFQVSFSSREHPIWMLVGKRGIGKKTLSIRLACFIINKCSNEWETSALTKNLISKTSQNLIYLSSLSSSKTGLITKLQIDKLKSIFKLNNLDDNPRVVIIDKLNSLTNNAMNAILKIIEEPPKEVFFIFLVDNINEIIPTLISRSQKLIIKGPDKSECIKIVKPFTSHINEKEIDVLLVLSSFSPGIVLELLEMDAYIIYVDLLSSLLDKSKINQVCIKFSKLNLNSKNSIFLVNLLLRRIISIAIKYSLYEKNYKNDLILNESEVLNKLTNKFKYSTFLDILNDLEIRIKRIKVLNTNISFEMAQVLNQFH